MAVFLSPVGGVAAQFFTNTGAVLTGGKLYTYAAGTTTPVATYSSANGNTFNTNPVVLDAAGRVPNSGEIWLADGVSYKFVLKDSNDVLIATYDNITGINSNFVNYTNQQEIQTATANQTVFTLVDMTYNPGTGSLSVFVDGVNQYGPGAQYAFLETDSSTVTFVSGLHVGASVKFTTSQINSASATDAEQVSYIPPYTNSVATNVEAKLAQTVSVQDFGAVGNGSTDDTAAIQAAINSGARQVVFGKGGIYVIKSQITLVSNQDIIGNGATVRVDATSTIGSAFYGVDIQDSTYSELYLNCNSKTISGFRLYASSTGCNGIVFQNCQISGTATDATLFYGGIEVSSLGGAAGTQNSNIKVVNCNFGPTGTHGCLIAYTDGVLFSGNRVTTATNHGMEAVGCRNVVITDNIVFNCTLSGLGVGSRTRDFNISNNTIKNCGGDASITCEFNSVFGVISGNTIFDANTSGINISFGGAGPAPFDKVQGVICTDNVIKAKSGTTTFVGVNYYSSTGSGLGSGVIVSSNYIEGFNIGVAYYYSNDGQISNNTIINLTGTLSAAVKATLVSSVDITNNSCNTDTGDHSYQVLSYAGSHSAYGNISENFAAASGAAAKALVYIDGPNTFTASGNGTGGSLNYVLTNSTATVVVADNYGPLAASAYAGSGTYNSQIGSANATTVGAAGGASALPATPLGYVTVFVVGIGQVKVPYYNV